MHIGIVGATGFVGSHILDACIAANYTVTALVNPRKHQQMQERYPQVQWVSGEFAACPPDTFAQCSHFINAVGIIRATRRGSFEDVHKTWPQAIMATLPPSCFIIQVSALGANPDSSIAYQHSKGRMESWLRDQRPQHCIFQPSFIVDADAPAMQVFTRLACLPLCPLPGGGHYQLQPMAIGDLVAAIMVAVEQGQTGTFPCGGAQAMSLRAILACIRRHQGRKAAIPIPIPGLFIKAGAIVTDLIGIGPISGDEWAMLQQGSTCDNDAFSAAFAVEPQGFETYWPAMIQAKNA